LRIVGGKLAGRDLTSPNDFRVHPTAERVRSALLDLLAPEVTNARVVDLFAGTGALGLEALSRGARSADFVETRPSSLHALRANVAALRVRERTRIFKRDALPFAAALKEDSYDIAFLDPPYGSRMLDRVLEGWRTSRFARVLAVEHASTHDLPRGSERRTFDETSVTIYRIGDAATRPALRSESSRSGGR
jgi:16S rRNA (guanine966-N2)-methyltransferase